VNTAFVYDRNGNVTTIGTGYSITGTSYDWRNLLLSITKSSTIYSYKYDHQGNRTYKNSGATRYVRGAFGEVLAVYNSSTLLHHNILRPDGTVIGRREGSNRLYYHRDHLGSTRAVVNASGTVVETQDYYPFGLAELVPKTFGMPGRSMVSGNSAKEKFTSHELDDGLDLYYMVARRYAPEFGRFMSPDPLADEFPGWSSYNYTFNNPLSFVDPDGRMPDCPDCDFLSSFKHALSRDLTFLGDLFRADQQGQLEQKIAQDLNDAGNAAVDAVKEQSGTVAVVSGVGVLALGTATFFQPQLGPLTVPAMGELAKLGFSASAVNFGATAVDVAAFDGTTSELALISHSKKAPDSLSY